MKHASNPRRGRGRGGKRNQPSKNRNYDSNGGDNKVRGNAQQILDKYLALARDASSAGDRIAAEGYFQHAEHYYRILNVDDGKPKEQPHSQPQSQPQHDNRADGDKEAQAQPAPEAKKPETQKPKAQNPEGDVKIAVVEGEDKPAEVKPKPRRGRPKKVADDGEPKSETAA